MYSCPMHPEVTSNTPAKCSKCGMMLVKKGEAESGESDYTPLIVIIALILLVSGVLGYQDYLGGVFSLKQLVSYFMIGFFLTFSGFKLMDLQGFVHGYTTYDLLAKRLPVYGFVYPFIELFFGIGMIFTDNPSLLLAEVLIMGFSGLGVTIKLLKKEKFQCVCLGTALKVPLTKVTLIEDFGMAALAMLLFFLP